MPCMAPWTLGRPIFACCEAQDRMHQPICETAGVSRGITFTTLPHSCLWHTSILPRRTANFESTKSAFEIANSAVYHGWLAQFKVECWTALSRSRTVLF